MNFGNGYFGAVATPPVILTYTSTMILDMSAGNHFQITLLGNLNLSNPINVIKDGQPLLLCLIQDGTGSRTLTLGGSQFAFGTDITSITLTTTAAKMDYIGMLWHAAMSKWHVVSVVQGF